MSKNLEVSILYDFYKELLTDKQADVIDLYYNQDLSLSEISEHMNITRQGVRDCIKRGEKILFDLEERLGLASRFLSIQQKIKMVNETIQHIEDINNSRIMNTELKKKIDIVKNAMNDIFEKVY
ncbi:YlxM family DNA-binding protein [Petroclostridium sp. X23]|uniref:YlxM family DNA-binding protein n=1 Tax=Petroclostridium sp. X23 TaxID=3045146 RepID=UPI0024AE6CA1|nr:YlxM family DNA-binding protein [Petroclostridium sp. X23]WHH59420.1 YlxM family DNA-binding protein [Petroclostridium sp. X23]